MGIVLPLFLLFLGIFFAGDIIAIPSLYIAAVSSTSLYEILALSVIATLAADMLWYMLGRHFAKERLHALPFLRNNTKARRALDILFDRNPLKTIFCSRFVYGVRLMTQGVAGTHRVPFLQYVAVDSAGIIVWFSGIALLISFVKITLGDLQETALGVQIVAGILVLALVAINIIGRKLLHIKNGTEKA